MDNPKQRPARKIYSVSELTKDIKKILESRYPLIWVSGELSNLRIPASGHAYFSLKDNNAQLSAVMFRAQLRQLQFDIEDGMSVLAMGRISIYEPRGSYQMILEYAEPKGVGALQIAFEQLRNKLGAEGLFDDERKQTLPFLPTSIGVVTSSTGAVIQDMLNVINRRYSNINLDLYPVRVQGEMAADEIVTAIELANRRAVNDVIVLARGGGSLEDLAPFNSEAVARAIAESAIPVISAVGHETDFTISDFVADLRAPTPSVAAELVVPVKNELQARCLELKQRCGRSVLQYVDQMRQQMELLAQGLVHPGKRVQDNRMHLDHRVNGLMRQMNEIVRQRKSDCDRLVTKLAHQSPSTSIRQHRSALNIARFKLWQNMRSIYGKYSERINTSDALLKALNPNAILKRGYSIVRTLPDRKVVMDSASIRHGQLLDIQLANGKIEALAHKKNDDRQKD